MLCISILSSGIHTDLTIIHYEDSMLILPCLPTSVTQVLRNIAQYRHSQNFLPTVPICECSCFNIYPLYIIMLAVPVRRLASDCGRYHCMGSRLHVPCQYWWFFLEVSVRIASCSFQMHFYHRIDVRSGLTIRLASDMTSY